MKHNLKNAGFINLKKTKIALQKFNKEKIVYI